jgi:hypothetical protein
MHLAADCCLPSRVASTSTWLWRLTAELSACKVETRVALASVCELIQMKLAA